MRTKNQTGYGRTWTEEEFIITMDLYFNTNPQERDAHNKKIQKVAYMLDRTPASIVYRLGNYSAIDPDAKLKGFDNGGKTVRVMFNKYSADRVKLGQLAINLKEFYQKKFMVNKEGIKAFVDNFNGVPDVLEAQLKACEDLHKKFLARWPKDNLAKLLTLENYAIGKGDKDSFCYWLERETRPLGSILGSPAVKFKVYFSKNNGKYEWVKGFGSAKEAFDATKKAIIGLINNAESKDYDGIKNNKLFKSSHMFRNKVLFLYFPGQFLNVFAEEDVDFFLERLGIGYLQKDHILDKQMSLIKYKENVPYMKDWSNLKFGYFLYNQFKPPSKTTTKTFAPRGKTDGSQEAMLGEEGVYALPNPELTELKVVSIADIIPKKQAKGGGKGRKRFKLNYVLETMRNKKLGDQGEEIILLYERQMLLDANQDALSARVSRDSLDDDSLGYDIKSFSSDGKIKYIEVKATRSGVENNMPLYLTENERSFMEENKNNYFIYRVFGANTTAPKLLIIDNKLLCERFKMKTKLWELSVA